MASLPTIRQMQGYAAIARLGSFSRAARQLGVSQSALSQSVQQMEFLLDAKLIERSRQSVTLTPAGITFLLRTERILKEIDEAVTAVREETSTDQGSVAVSCLSTVATLIVPSVVRSFKKRYPRVSVSIRDENVDGIMDQVKSGAVDFAITCLFSDDPDMAFEALIKDRFRFVCHRDHPLAGRESVEWDHLRNLDMVTVARGSGVRSLVDRALPDAHVFDNALYEVSRVPSVLRIVEEGGVVSALPALTLASARLNSALYHCPLVNPEVHREVGILTVRDKPLTTLAAAFRRATIETLQGEGLLEGYPDVHLVRRKP